MLQLQVQTKQLFDFQQNCVNQIQSHLKKGDRRILLISLMGTGKTVMASWLINQHYKLGKRCLFLVDLTCLIDQISDELREWGIPFTVLQADRQYDPTLPVIIASAQTVDARIKNGDGDIQGLLGCLDLIIYDEAHNLSYRQIAIALNKHYENSVLLGMTATPWRLNPKEHLAQYYDRTVVTLQPPELIKIGRAVPCRIFGFEDYFDLDKIATDKDGDFNEEDMAAQAVQTRNLDKVYQEWERLTPGQSTIAFCATVEHAKAIAEYFNSKGVESAYITGETSRGDRKELFAKLADGSLKVLASINTLTAGFNAPKVSCVLYIRLTRSKALYHQATGRAARQYPGKEFFYILDFGSNYRRLGSPMTYQDYSIHGKAGKTRSKFKICPECGAFVSVFARLCPECGYEFTAPDEGESEFEDAELDLDVEMTEFFCREDRKRLSWFRKAKKRAYKDNQHPDTATTAFKENYGFLPPSDWHLHAVLGKSPSEEAIASFQAYLQQFAPHDFWISVQMRFELGESVKRKKEKSKKNYTRDRQNERKPRYSNTIGLWWEVLKVSRNATYEEVKSAYRALIRQWHPDVCKEEIAENKAKELNNAYDEYLKTTGR